MPASDSLTAKVIADDKGNHSIIVLQGRFTFAAHTAFKDVLLQNIDSMPCGGALIFDLTSVEFVDSAALGMLLLAREAALKRAGSVVLRKATGQVQRMLAVSKFETMFLIEQ